MTRYPGIFNTQTCPHQASSNSLIKLCFPISAPVPMAVLVQESLLGGAETSWICLSLFSIWEPLFALCLPPLNRSKKSSFFSLFSFFLLFRQSGNWQAPSLHAELETRSLHYLFIKLILIKSLSVLSQGISRSLLKQI